VAVHFLHIGKTGGTAIKWALRRSEIPDTPYGPIQLHRHSFKMRQVPLTDRVIFFVRDPISRFMSGFYSRQSKGQPRYYYEWTEGERAAFEAFPSPQALAAALGSEEYEQRRQARRAIRSIRHTRPMYGYTGGPLRLRLRSRQIIYIGRLETINADWKQIKALLELPPELKLPTGPWRAHRQKQPLDMTLDDSARRSLEEAYRGDFKLVEYCDKVRERRGWGVG
jgi:Sulfotransferase family